MNIDEIKDYVLNPAIQVAIIMALVEMIKRTELVGTRFLFLLDLAIGVVMGVAVYYAYLGMHPVLSILIGVVLGVMASGLFSGVKSMLTLNGDPYIGNEEETEEEYEDEV